MRREGRPHGTVLCFSTNILPAADDGDAKKGSPAKRIVNELRSPATYGSTTRVPAKPTNHSRYTSRCRRPGCRGCHEHPVAKSRAKAKGSHKLRRLVDGAPARLSSATGILNELLGGDDDDGDEDLVAAEISTADRDEMKLGDPDLAVGGDEDFVAAEISTADRDEMVGDPDPAVGGDEDLVATEILTADRDEMVVGDPDPAVDGDEDVVAAEISTAELDEMMVGDPDLAVGGDGAGPRDDLVVVVDDGEGDCDGIPASEIEEDEEEDDGEGSWVVVVG